MKKSTSLVTYIAALVIGIILLALHEQVQLLKGVVVAMGVLITVPSAIMFLSCFFGKKDAYGNKSFPAWYTVIVAVAGLVLGVWMLCKPGWFEVWMVYTLGVILVLVGAAQVVNIYNVSRPFGANPLWYCVPILVLAGGLIIIFLGPRGTNVWASITTGILLIVYAANGLAAVGREVKTDENRRIEHDDTSAGDLSD